MGYTDSYKLVDTLTQCDGLNGPSRGSIREGIYLLNVAVVVEGVTALDEGQLANLSDNLRGLLGALDPAPVFWPGAKEVGVHFQITEETFGRLLQPVESSRAA